ncbi:MAG: sulfatase-like hydrolase/transferase [Planctomycetota bacterium]
MLYRSWKVLPKKGVRQEGGAAWVSPARLAVALALSCPWLAGCGSSSAAPVRNVLLVTLDTTRADHVGCYGGPAGITPHVDALAARGVLFKKVVAPVPLTLPSHTSILTGLEPYHHGVHDNGIYKVGADSVTLAEILSGEGWETAAFVASYVLSAQFGLDQGFGLYDDRVDRTRGVELGTLQERSADAVTNAFLEWLERREGSRPFFAWVHYFDPHHPYEPPPAYTAKFPAQPYNGEIAYADAELGRLWEVLRKRGFSERTLIVVTADHGEGLGEHGEPTHGHFVYDSTIRVPLILSHPSLPQGVQSDELARLVDIAPTILSFLGVERRGTMDGADLLARMREASEPTIAYAESELPRIQFGFSPLRAVTDGQIKLIDAPHPELYDLTRDPSEMQSIAEKKGDIVERLREALAALPTAAARDASHDPGAAALSQVAALGYASGVSQAAVTTREWSNAELLAMIELRNEAKSLLTVRRHEEAIAKAHELVQRAPRSYAGYELLGTALANAGRYQEALEPLHKAIELQAELRDAHWNLAVCHANMGLLDQAYEEIAIVLKIDPHHLPANRKMAERFLKANEAAQAKPYLRILIEYGGQSAEAQWARERLAKIGEH